MYVKHKKADGMLYGIQKQWKLTRRPLQNNGSYE